MPESHHQPVRKSATQLTMPTSLRTSPWLFCGLLLGLAAAQAEEQQATQSFVYKKPQQADLELIVHYPSDWKETDKRPAIVFFFGGGWTGGKIGQFSDQDNKGGWIKFEPMSDEFEGQELDLNKFAIVATSLPGGFEFSLLSQATSETTESTVM